MHPPFQQNVKDTKLCCAHTQCLLDGRARPRASLKTAIRLGPVGREKTHSGSSRGSSTGRITKIPGSLTWSPRAEGQEGAQGRTDSPGLRPPWSETASPGDSGGAGWAGATLWNAGGERALSSRCVGIRGGGTPRATGQHAGHLQREPGGQQGQEALVSLSRGSQKGHHQAKGAGGGDGGIWAQTELHQVSSHPIRPWCPHASQRSAPSSCDGPPPRQLHLGSSFKQRHLKEPVTHPAACACTEGAIPRS